MLEDALDVRDVDAKVVGLDKLLGDDTVLDESSVAAGSGVAKELGGIRDEGVKLLGELASGVGNEADVGGGVQGVGPGLGDEGVVDGDDKDLADALVLELGKGLDVAGGVRRSASRGKGTWDTDNEVLALVNGLAYSVLQLH